METEEYTEWSNTLPLHAEVEVQDWGPSGVMPCEVRRAVLALGCSLFGCVMTVSEPPKVNDVHKRKPQ